MALFKVDITAESLTTSLASYYTAPNLADTLDVAEIVYCVAHNYSSVITKIFINIVKSGDPITNKNQYIEKNIGANQTVSLPIVGRILKTGDRIYASSSASSSINLNIGIKETSV